AAKMCVTDAVLLLFVTAAQVCLLALYSPSPRTRGEGWGEGSDAKDRTANPKKTPHPNPLPRYRERGPEAAIAALMWIAIALAGLTKGPVVVGVQLMTMLALAAIDVGREWKSPAAWRRAIRWW